MIISGMRRRLLASAALAAFLVQGLAFARKEETQEQADATIPVCDQKIGTRASGGEFRGGSNVGKGLMKAADYVLVPDIANRNASSGGKKIGGLLGGLVGGVARSGVRRLRHQRPHAVRR